MAGFEQYAHVPLHNIGPRHDGAAGYHLGYAVIRHGVEHGVVLAVGDERAVYEVPVYQESSLYGVDHSAFDPEVRIAPGVPRGSLHVPQGDVHAPYEAHPAVYYAQLAVVSVVNLTREGRKAYRHKRLNVYPGVAHTLEEPVAYIPASHVVIYQSDLYSLARLVYERIGHQVAQRIVYDDVRHHVYVGLRAAYGLEQGEYKLIAIGKYLYVVVLEWQRPVLVGKHADDPLVCRGQRESALLGKLEHTALRELLQATLADHTFPSRVLPEEEIEHHAYHWDKREHQYPRQSLGGLAVVHQHAYQGKHDDGGVE